MTESYDVMYSITLETIIMTTSFASSGVWFTTNKAAHIVAPWKIILCV